MYRVKYKNPIELLIQLTLEPMQFKIVLLILGYVTCQFSFALILTIYRMLSTFDKKILLRHGSFGGIEIFVSVLGEKKMNSLIPNKREELGV